MKNTILSAMACAMVLGSAAIGFAESSIQYHGGAQPKYDKKIQAAAIKRAASKIGDLRGSVSGFSHSLMMTERDLSMKSSSLGFPRMQEPAA